MKLDERLKKAEKEIKKDKKTLEDRLESIFMWWLAITPYIFNVVIKKMIFKWKSEEYLHNYWLSKNFIFLLKKIEKKVKKQIYIKEVFINKLIKTSFSFLFGNSIKKLMGFRILNSLELNLILLLASLSSYCFQKWSF